MTTNSLPDYGRHKVYCADCGDYLGVSETWEDPEEENLCANCAVQAKLAADDDEMDACDCGDCRECDAREVAASLRAVLAAPAPTGVFAALAAPARDLALLLLRVVARKAVRP